MGVGGGGGGGGGGEVNRPAQISVTKVYDPTIRALRCGGGIQFPEKKRCVTFEWPL